MDWRDISTAPRVFYGLDEAAGDDYSVLAEAIVHYDGTVEIVSVGLLIEADPTLPAPPPTASREAPPAR